MSDFLAEARVRIVPDTTGFRAALVAQIAAATRTLPPIPVTVAAATGAGAAGAAAAAGTAELAAAQRALASQSLGLASTEQVLNTALGRQAVLLEGVTVATAQTAGAQAALQRSSKASTASLLGLGSSTGKLDAALLGLRTAAGSTAVIGLGAAALAAIVLGKAVRAASDLAADFETQMNVLGATTGASAEQIRQAADAARQLGEDATLPAVSAGDAAQAITELSKAGLSLEESISGARGVLELATAASIDNAAATELAANALNAFGLAGEQATHVADLLANASIAAQGSIEDVGIALQQSAAAGAQVGLTLDDTVALLTLLAKNGLSASDAGTSLRVSLLRLVAPTKEAQQVLDQLNIKVRDAQGNVRPEVFAEFGVAVAKLGPELRDAAAAAVFGADGFRTISLLSREGATGLAEARGQLAQTGTAAELAGARTKGFAGALGALQSSAETLGATLGQLLNTSLLPLIDALTGFVTVVNRVTDSIRTFGDVNIPVIGEVGDRFGDLLKVIGPLAVFRLPVQGLQQFNKFAGGAASLTEQLNEKLDETKQKLDTALSASPVGASAGVLEKRAEQVADLRRQVELLQDTLAKAGAPVDFVPASSAAVRRGETLRREAARVGEDIGKAMGEGIGKGLDESVKAAINSAKANLLSIGADLASQVGELIDAGPLGQQIERLQNALTARQASRQRLGLLDDLADARRQVQLAQLEVGPLARSLEDLQAQLDKLRQTDAGAGASAALRQAQAQLREAREAVQGVGPGDTARQRRDIAEFLDPFIENVRDAKSTLQQQNLEGRIDKLTAKLQQRRELFTQDDVATAKKRVADIQAAIRDFDDAAVIKNLQDTVAAQKKAVEQGINDLVAQFNAGQIKLAAFNKRLAALIGANVGPFQTAGAALGKAFAARFIETVAAAMKQARGLAPFAGQTPGTGQAPAVVSVQDAIKAAAEKTAANTDGLGDKIDKLPQRIAAAIKNPGAASKTPGPGQVPSTRVP